MNDIALIDRYAGTLMGLAAADALGTTLEFQAPGTFKPITDMVGGGVFGLPPGAWTDDTSMALCLAESLIENQGFDSRDQMQRYLRWWRHGYLSSVGECFDIGNTIRAALAKFELYGTPYSGETDPRYAGNGSLMRLAPIPLAYRLNPESAVCFSGDMSRTTHGASEPVDACRAYTGLIIGALEGEEKSVLLSEDYLSNRFGRKFAQLTDGIASVLKGAYKVKQPPEIRGTGYVVKSLEAALWAFWTTESFHDGALAAVNLGDDADTTGAIYGQLAGSYYGLPGIPQEWSEKLIKKEVIMSSSEKLLALSEVI